MSLGIVCIINHLEIVYVIVLWKLILSTCLGHRGAPDIWLNIILGVSAREEINTWIRGLWKPIVGLIQSTEGLIEQKGGAERICSLPESSSWDISLLQPCTWIGIYSICSLGSQSCRLGLEPWAILSLQPAGCRSRDFAASKTTRRVMGEL